MGHYIYEYPAEMQAQRKQYGAKIFYYRCQLIDDASFRLETRLYKDYAWVARSELKDYFDEATAAYLYEVLPE